MKQLALFSVIILTLFASCGGSSERAYVKNPTDDLVRDLYKESAYSIILHDMDVDDSGFSNKYYHTYRIIREKDTLLPGIDTTKIVDGKPVIDENAPLTKTRIPYDSITSKFEVPDRFFRSHENDMGMTIVWKDEKGVHKNTASPPGYNKYVGNSRYGHWNGGIWQFYGQYMFMSSMFGMMSRPVYYNDYNTYRTSYYGRSSYYGRNTGSGYSYGTNSSYNKSSNPSFFQRRQSKTGWSSSSSSRTSSSGSSRYGSSSGRSGGGGFGK